jgi:predicted transglutaminase-like cysteine proteinase
MCSDLRTPNSSLDGIMPFSRGIVVLSIDGKFQLIQCLQATAERDVPKSKLTTALLILLPLSAVAGYRFDAPETYLAEASALPAWGDTLERHADERTAIDDCMLTEEKCEGRLNGLRVILHKGANLEPDQQLKLVNRYINKRRYRRDRKQMSLSVAEGGQAKLRNHWSTLLDFLYRGGDCEDYATAKYFLLRELGYQADDMRVVVSYDHSVRQHHAVLAIRQADDSSWLLEIDNTIRKSRQSGYRFIYALNENGIWDHEG